MISSWTFYNPTRIIFRENAIDEIGDLTSGAAILVTSPGFRRRGIVERVERLMEGRLSLVVDRVEPNPGLDAMTALKNLTSAREVNSIIALGGGSVIDTAKALSRIIPYSVDGSLPGGFWEESFRIKRRGISIVAIPTTAGTGSEVTPTATVWDYSRGVKLSLRGEDLYPRAALLDPVLTHDLPESVTVSSGLDAISHALESIWNKNASPVSMELATRSLQLSLDALPRLKENGADFEARSLMMQASLMAGMAISQTRTALSHSISYPLTLEHGIPHGIACSFALPEILEFNASADDGRLETLAIALVQGTVQDLKTRLSELLGTLLSPELALGSMLKDAPTPDLLRRMYSRSRTENNIRSVELRDLDHILRNAKSRMLTM